MGRDLCCCQLSAVCSLQSAYCYRNLLPGAAAASDAVSRKLTTDLSRLGESRDGYLCVLSDRKLI